MSGYQKKDYRPIDAFINKHGFDATYRKFKERHPNYVISDTAFYNRRNKLLSGQVDKKTAQAVIDYSTVDNFLNKNPSASYNEFKEAHPDFEISDCAFYTRRRKLNGSSYHKGKSSSSKIYVHLCTLDSAELVKMSKIEALREVLNSLNNVFRSKMELVEMKNPDQIVIWEAKK